MVSVLYSQIIEFYLSSNSALDFCTTALSKQFTKISIFSFILRSDCRIFEYIFSYSILCSFFLFVVESLIKIVILSELVLLVFVM